LIALPRTKRIPTFNMASVSEDIEVEIYKYSRLYGSWGKAIRRVRETSDVRIQEDAEPPFIQYVYADDDDTNSYNEEPIQYTIEWGAETYDWDALTFYSDEEIIEKDDILYEMEFDITHSTVERLLVTADSKTLDNHYYFTREGTYRVFLRKHPSCHFWL
jgi:hypothetical protein